MKTLQVTGWASVKTYLLPDNRVWVQATANNGDYVLVTWSEDGTGDTIEETYTDSATFDKATDNLFRAVQLAYWTKPENN